MCDLVRSETARHIRDLLHNAPRPFDAEKIPLRGVPETEMGPQMVLAAAAGGSR